MSSSNLNNKHTARFNQRKRAYLKRTNRYRRPCIEKLETRRLLVGELDLTFGTAGNVITDFGFAGQFGSGYTDIALQDDAKMLALGATNSGTRMKVLAARYLENGTLDQSFADNGLLKLDLGSRQGGSEAICIQQDKKIIIAGGAIDSNGLEYFYATRLLENGTLDSGFANNGIFTYQIKDGYVQDIKVQPDGKIVMVGGAGIAVDNRTLGKHLVVRLTQSGTLDTTFGNQGIVLRDTWYRDKLYSVVIQQDGSLIAVGETGLGFNRYRACIWKLKNNGETESFFTYTPTYERSVDRATSIAVNKDESLIVVASI
jgi:uncharacterized delta-60 repeat protein